jgi:hypothetical protein
MVDPQLAFDCQGLKVPGQHIGCRHVHRHNGIAAVGEILGDVVQQPAQTIQRFGGVQDPGLLAQLFQSQAQGSGAAQGIAVGTAVGQDGKIIMGQEKARGLSPGQILRHRA